MKRLPRPLRRRVGRWLTTLGGNLQVLGWRVYSRREWLDDRPRTRLPLEVRREAAPRAYPDLDEWLAGLCSCCTGDGCLCCKGTGRTEAA